MIRTRRFITPLIISLLVACADNDESDSQAAETPKVTSTITEQYELWLNDISNNLLLPSYQSFALESELLQQQAEQFCSSTLEQSALVELQTKWNSANAAWQKVQWVKIGPVLENSRIYRIQFWPDDNNAVKKGLALLLSNQETITSDYVSNINVGAQGFPALEQLLFTTESAESLLTASNKEKRCEAVEAITANIMNISTNIYNEWRSDDGNYIEQLQQGTGEFSSSKDAVEELVTNWLEHLEFIKDDKMLVPLGESIPGEPLTAENWLSEASLENIKINLQTLQDIYTAGDGYGFDDILTNFLEQPSIESEMSEVLLAMNTSIDSLSGDYTDILNDEESRAKLETTIEYLRSLRTVLSADFIQSMDISIGFNSNDGD